MVKNLEDGAERSGRGTAAVARLSSRGFGSISLSLQALIANCRKRMAEINELKASCPKALCGQSGRSGSCGEWPKPHRGRRTRHIRLACEERRKSSRSLTNTVPQWPLADASGGSRRVSTLQLSEESCSESVRSTLSCSRWSNASDSTKDTVESRRRQVHFFGRVAVHRAC